MRSVFCWVCFAIRAFQPGFPLFYARRSRRGGRIDPALLPVSVSVFMRRKRLLKKLFSASRSGGKDRRAARSLSSPTRIVRTAPAAPSASRRRSSVPAPAADPASASWSAALRHGDNAEPYPPGYAAQFRRHIRPALPPLHPHPQYPLAPLCDLRQYAVSYP